MPDNSQVAVTSELPKGAWFVVTLLFIVGALNYLDRTMITTMRSSIVEEIPMSDAQFGLLTSIFLWVYGLLSPFAGFLADRISRSKVIIGSLFLWSAVTWLTAYARTFEELLATRALMGISEACYIPAALALIVDYHKGSTRSLATGIHIAGVMVGQSLGFIGGWMAEEYNWSFVFSVFGIVGILYAPVLVFTLRDAPAAGNHSHMGKAEHKINFLMAVKDLFGRAPFIIILIFWGLIGVVGWLVMGWLPTYYKEQFSLSQGLAGFYATGYLYPASIFGLLIGGFWADRWSRFNPHARILVPIIGLVIAAPCIFMASITTVLPLAIVFFMLYALTRMFVETNLMPILCMVADSRYRATGYGILNMFATMIGGLGIYAAGILRDSQINLGKVYQFTALIIVICTMMLYMVKRTQK
ncbi:MAG: MFS transporter [Cytophagales bacterium]|nr:MFS transporter [Cytophagales bacterium]